MLNLTLTEKWRVTTLQNMPELDNSLHPRKHVSHIGCRYEML